MKKIKAAQEDKDMTVNQVSRQQLRTILGGVLGSDPIENCKCDNGYQYCSYPDTSCDMYRDSGTGEQYIRCGDSSPVLCTETNQFI